MSNNFEMSLLELKKIVARLEEENISLDEAVELYKKGIDLSKECRDKLNAAEEVVKKVIDSNGKEEELNGIS